MKRITLQRALSALFIVVLSGVLMGAYSIQFFKDEMPCPLCLLQRVGMIGVALGQVLNLRFGMRPAHHAFSIFSALCGASVSIRQITLHICPGFPTFGEPVFGASLYTWAFITFVASIFAIGCMLFLYKNDTDQKAPPKMELWAKAACGLILLITVANIFTTFWECGPLFCPEI